MLLEHFISVQYFHENTLYEVANSRRVSELTYESTNIISAR